MNSVTRKPIPYDWKQKHYTGLGGIFRINGMGEIIVVCESSRSLKTAMKRLGLKSGVDVAMCQRVTVAQSKD